MAAWWTSRSRGENPEGQLLERVGKSRLRAQACMWGIHKCVRNRGRAALQRRVKRQSNWASAPVVIFSAHRNFSGPMLESHPNKNQ
jgi:hypothetical protein